jgi:hypothetical protein
MLKVVATFEVNEVLPTTIPPAPSIGAAPNVTVAVNPDEQVAVATDPFAQ